MIRVEGLHKAFGRKQVLQDISLQVGQGEVLALIGPSGGGKSTLLRTLNWLEVPDAGVITLDGIRVEAGHPSASQLRRLRQKTAMVFQNYNLFRNKTALDNVALPLEVVKGLSRDAARERAAALLARVDLAREAQQYPVTLSGGQQQRVGIARALALDPAVILFDEPTSSLDPERVAEVLSVIRQLAHRDIAMIISTHEIPFARQVADQVLFMDGGRIVEAGSASAVLDTPAQARTRRFLRQLDPVSA